MIVEVGFAKGGFRRWHRRLGEILVARVPGARVRFVERAPPASLPGVVTMLLELERLVLRRAPGSIWESENAPPPLDHGGEADVFVDATGAATDTPSTAPLRLRPLFDGAPGEGALFGALLRGGVPEVAIEDVAARVIVARGKPSAETADGLRGGAEAALSRVITLLARAIAGPRDALAPSAASGGPAAMTTIARHAAKDMVNFAVRSVYRMCFYPSHWRVGWRFVDGPGVMERHDLDGPKWRLLKCDGNYFSADPFPVTWRGKTCIFLELLDHRVGKGIIAAADVGPDGPGELYPVIEEPWHLSYPFMIEYGGELWMIPESSASRVVPIYRCIEFPRRWEKTAVLVDHIEAADCTVFRHDGRFWMMSVTRDGMGGYSDTLSIHHAPDLFGPWEEHRQRPVMVDIAAARPAGHVVFRDGVPWRPLQDCRGGYGRALGIARIDRLTPDDFAQTVVATVNAGPAWPGKRIHTLNRFGTLEVIDGVVLNPRLAALRGPFGVHADP